MQQQTVSTGDRGRPDMDSAYQVPSSDVERKLTVLWQNTLGVSPIGINDNFFELGGDSIEAIQIQHFINRDFKLNLKNTEFLENATIAGMSQLIEDAT